MYVCVCAQRLAKVWNVALTAPKDGIKENLAAHMKKHYVGGGPFKFNSFLTDDQFQDGFTARFHAIKNNCDVTLSPRSDYNCYWISLGSTESISEFFEDYDCAFVQIDDQNHVFVPHLQLRYEKEPGCPYGRIYWHYYVRRLTEEGLIFDAW